MSITSSTSRRPLTAQKVRIGYGGLDVVRDVDLQIPPAAVTALIGPNGSGKSTLLRGIARLRPLSAGRVSLGDQDLRVLSPRALARNVAMLAQARPIPAGLTVAEIVEFGRHPHRGRWRTRDPRGAEAIKAAMELTAICELADEPIETLSGGQLQRVWLAACLAQDTEVLLLDEPTTFLDLRHQEDLLALIRTLADRGVTVAVVLHDLSQAAAIADQVVLLDHGQVLAAGTCAQVLTAQRLSELYGLPVTVTTTDDGTLRIDPVRTRQHRSR